MIVYIVHYSNNEDSDMHGGDLLGAFESFDDAYAYLTDFVSPDDLLEPIHRTEHGAIARCRFDTTYITGMKVAPAGSVPNLYPAS